MEGDKKKKKASTKKTKKKETSSSSSSAAGGDKGAKHIEAAEKWIKSSKNSSNIKFVKHDKGEHKLIFKFADEDMSFECTYPLDADDIWLVTSEELEDKWTSAVSDACMGASGIEEILKIATSQFAALSDEEFSDDDGGEEEEEFDDDLGFAPVDTSKKEKKEPSSEPTIDTRQFIIPAGYEAGAIQAIAQQLGHLMKMPKEEKEFEAGPLDNNITQWEVKLWGIPKDDDLYKDMQRLGVSHITLHVTFPPDFPFSPPFLRVVRPRFAFRTGHVTIGGAICTFLLSNEGWNPLYRLPQVLVDVRAMLTAGKGRLDAGNRSDYTENEAMDAFRRLLATHGWTHWKK